MDQAVDTAKPVRDSRHYLGSVTILIDNNLFKVPKRYFAKDLSIFGDILPLSQRDPEADDASDDNPVYLKNISTKDFESLLEVIFPIHGSAIASLQRIDPVDKIWLGKTFRMIDWILAGYKTLVMREAAISEEEGEKLGLKTVIRLFRARESATGKRSRKPSCTKNISVIIRLAVAQELPGAELEGTPTPTWTSTDSRISLNSEWARHGRFYMENIIFLVEDTLFKVPRASFEHSELFATIFSLSTAENTVVDGSDDEHPFKLDGISKPDFQAFLEVLYPCSTPMQIGSMNQTIWISTLKLSTMWDFFEVRKLAIQTLSTMEIDPVSQVANALQYNVPEWLFAGLESLVKRKEAISISEAKTLGLETTIRIYQIREDGLARYHGYAEDSGSVRANCDFTEGIQREFAEELALREVDETVESG